MKTMEEKTVRKLPFVLEVLLIAVILFAVSLLKGLIISRFTNLVIAGEMTINTLSTLNIILGLLMGSLAMFLGGVVCFKLIEKRPIHWSALLLIGILYQLLSFFPSMIVTAYMGSYYGEVALASYSKVNIFVSPILAAVVLAIIVRLLTAPKEENASPVQIGLFGHVLLLLFTCGIWHLIWIYRTTGYLNCVPGEPYRNPGTKLLLCMLIPFYSIYWVYQSAQRIDKLAKSLDVTSDLAVVCLILEIFVPLIPPILMQDKINKIAATQTVEF